MTAAELTQDSTTAFVSVDDGHVIIESLMSEDPAVVGALARLDADSRPDAVRRMLGIGARAIVETAVGIDLAAIDQRVLRAIEQATRSAEARVRQIVTDAEAVMRTSLDPDTRTSAMARAIAEFEAVSASVARSIDPARTDSHVAMLLGSLTAMLGPGGELEDRLTAALDPANEGSGLAALRRDVESRFAEMRDLIAEQRGRRSEADVGTHKGFEFEDVLERRLRELARPIGAVVTRTSELIGSVGDCLVGDFVVTLQNGSAIVVEAKNTRSIGLGGSGGILEELDRAMSNRRSAVAICVSATAAFPSEVGAFGVYGNRILVVDDGEGSLLEVALRWATLTASASERTGADVDVARVLEVTDRVRRLAQSFSTHRRALTDSIDSIGRVREGLDDMRRDLLTQIDEIDFELERGQVDLKVVNGQ